MRAKPAGVWLVSGTGPGVVWSRPREGDILVDCEELIEEVVSYCGLDELVVDRGRGRTFIPVPIPPNSLSKSCNLEYIFNPDSSSVLPISQCGIHAVMDPASWRRVYLPDSVTYRLDSGHQQRHETTDKGTIQDQYY